MLLGLIIGFVVGAIAMYLLARNSPQHFGRVKKEVDKTVDKIGETFKDG